MLITSNEIEAIVNDRLGIQVYNSFEGGNVFGLLFKDDTEAEEYIDSLVHSYDDLLHKIKGEENMKTYWEVYYGKILEGFPHMEEFETEKEAKDFIYEHTGGDSGVLEDHIYMNFEENMEYYYVRSNFEEEEEYYYDDFGDEHSIWDYNDRPVYLKETRDYWHQAAQKGV